LKNIKTALISNKQGDYQRKRLIKKKKKRTIPQQQQQHQQHQQHQQNSKNGGKKRGKNPSNTFFKLRTNPLAIARGLGVSC
jgi:hypothetical protein